MTQCFCMFFIAYCTVARETFLQPFHVVRKTRQKPQNDQFKVFVNGIEQIFDPGGLMVSNCFLCVTTELYKDISYFRGKNSRL